MRQWNQHAPSGWHAVGAACIIGLSLAVALCVSRSLPYYFLWDMDLTASIDTLVMNGGRIPVHINHPGFGLNLVQALTQRVAHAVGHLSVLRLGDLERSLNPLAAMAEHTQFVRVHSPFVAVGIAVALWVALRRLLRPGPWTDLALLALLASQDGLLYQAGLVRTETYAILFWSIALVLVVRGTEGPLDRRRAVALLTAGVFLGISYLTKLQAIFYLAAVPLLLLRAAAPAGGIPAVLAPRTRREAKTAAATGALAFLLFAALLLHAHLTPGPSPLAHQIFTQELHLSAPGLAALAVYAALAGLLIFLVARGKWASSLFAFLRASALLLLGFVLAFALHLAPYGWSGEGLRYMAYDTKMLFFRTRFGAAEAGGGPFQQFWGQVEWDPALFALLGLIAVAAVRELWRARHERARAARALVLLGLSSIALLNAAVATRFVLRDLVWTQVLAMVVVLVAAFDLFGRKTAGRVIVVGLLALVMVEQVAHGRDVVRRLEANYNLYGFQEDRWFGGVYLGDHLRYGAIMNARYGGPESRRREVARKAAQRYVESRRAADYVLQEPRIDQRRIGVLSEGFPLWVSDTNRRVKALPEALREAIVIDPTGVTGGGARFVSELVRTHSEVREKIRGPGEPGSLALMPRADLRVFLFYEPGPGGDRFPACANAAASGHIVVDGMTLVGREITTYCEFGAAQLPRRHVVVVLPVTTPQSEASPGRRND